MAANTHALKFVKSSMDRVDFGSSALGSSIKDLSTFTIEAAIKVGNNTDQSALIYLERQNSGKLPRLSIAAWNNTALGVGRLRFEFARVDGTSDTNYTYSLNTLWDDYWHHVAFTVDVGEKEYNIYLDGAKVAVGSVRDGGEDGSENPLKVSNTVPAGIILGAGYNGSTYSYFDGKIDYVRIWSSVRSQGAIQGDMYDFLEDPSSESSLLEEWRLGEGTGTTTAGIKNPTWSATLRRNGAASSALWTTDRSHLGDGTLDETAPSTPTMTAPTNVTSSSFDLNFSGSTDDVYVQYYEITVATTSDFSSPVAGYSAKNVGLVSTFTVTGLTPSTNYYARVRALDAALNASAYHSYNSNAAIVTSSVGDITPPNAPVASAATSVTDTSFSANWAASTSPDVEGYKLDIAKDDSFTQWVLRNADVENVTTYSVSTGVEPSSTYYYRVRSYDEAENESVDSNTVEVTTANPPDLTPPDPVVLMPATSVASKSFTANWNVGVDNVAVTGYLLDLSDAENFSSLVLDAVDVGNVTSYGITDLQPLTGYYYRVRAYDAAGNIGPYSGVSEHVSTTPSTVDEGGLLSVVTPTIADAITFHTSGSHGVITGTAVNLQMNSSTRGYIKFDMSGVTGNIVNANFNFYVSVPRTATYKIRGLVSGAAWSESTLNHTLTLGYTYTTEEITFTNPPAGWNSIDVASLLHPINGECTLVIEYVSGTTSALNVDSRENTSNRASYLELEIDPTSSTELQGMSVSSDNVSVTNLLKNPNAETGGPSFGGTTGILAVVSATLTQDTTHKTSGNYSAKVVTATSNNSGIEYVSNTGLAIAAVGQQLRSLIWIRANGADSLSMVTKLTYTDTTTTTASQTVYLTNDWTPYEHVVTATTGKTIDSVSLIIQQSGTLSRTFWTDSAAVLVASDVAVSFDGNSNTKTDWNGTVNASASELRGVVVSALATYVGDGNENNSATVSIKRADESEFFPLGAAAIDRGTKKITADVGPILSRNYMRNPSFTDNLTGWGGDAILTRITMDGMEEVGSSDLACLKIESDEDEVAWSHYVPASNGQVWVGSVYARADSPMTVEVAIGEHGSTGTWLTGSTASMSLTTDWQRFSITRTLNNSSTRFVVLSFVDPSSGGKTWYVDRAQLERDILTPYIDGDQPDGWWEGLDNASASYRALSHDTLYDVMFEVEDDDGVLGGNPISVQVRTDVVPDDALTTVELKLTPTNTAIAVEASYTGDDNESAQAVVQWKRADLETWSKIRHFWNRNTRTVTANITNLTPGTDYNVRVSFSDSDDSVFGQNPLQNVVTTTTVGLAVESRTRISFGGFMLMGGDSHDIGVLTHDGFGHPTRRVQVESLPRTDGGVELSGWWGPRTIKMKGFLRGNTRGELNDRLREFRKAMAPRQQRLVIDTLDSHGYYFIGTCTNLSIPEEGGVNIRHIEWDAEFTCADPFKYENMETQESNIILTDSDQVAITNSGDLRIDPVFSLSTTSTTPITFSLYNLTTGERIHPLEPISYEDSFVIDSSKLSIRKNGVEIDYEGAFPTLAVGQNNFEIELSSGSVSLTVRRRHRFL